MSAAERARRGDFRSTTEQGYGWAHQRLRARWARKVERGLVACARCQQPIEPGQPWDLDHDDEDRSQYLGPSHAGCNRATFKSAPAAPAARLVSPNSQEW